MLLFHDIAGLYKSLQDWKPLCCKVWESEYDFLRIDRFAKLRRGGYTN